MKYRKKPVVIDAFRWTGDADQTEDPEWMIEALKSGKCEIKEQNISYLDGRTKRHIHMEIKTLEGIHCASQGDYIIRGVKGELYACKPDIFEMTYEPVE